MWEKQAERERAETRAREQAIECATERKQKRRESEWVSMRLGESEIEKGGGKGKSAALKTDAAAFLGGCSVCLHVCFLEYVCLREGWGCVNDASYTFLVLRSHSFPFLVFPFLLTACFQTDKHKLPNDCTWACLWPDKEDQGGCWRKGIREGKHEVNKEGRKKWRKEMGKKNSKEGKEGKGKESWEGEKELRKKDRMKGN